MTNVVGDAEGKWIDTTGRCHDEANASAGVIQTFYETGKSYLLLGKSYESLNAFAKAVQLSTKASMLDLLLRSLDDFSIDDQGKPMAYEWLRRLLLVARAAKFPTEEAIRAVKGMASRSRKSITEPVVIVAGGCDVNVEQHMQGYVQLLLEAFRDFKGTIISGGTTEGVSGLVGHVGHKYSDAIRTIGYIPESIPTGVSEDNRYSEIRYTGGHGFSPLEPLQYWIDIIASGIPRSQIKILGIDGDAIAAAEYRIGLSLGCCVAVVEGSGGEAARLVTDDDWNTLSTLIRPPSDAMTLRAFIGVGSLKPDADIRMTLARAIHQNYRRVRASSAQGQDPAMAEWDKLAEHLKESNLHQADDIFEKLRQIGCTAHKVTGRDIALMTFTKDESEVTAEMEHGRWNVERLLNGWTWGEKRDVTKKTSPYIVPWSELPNDVKEWDRETVRKIPEFLAKVGVEVRRQA